MWFWFSTENFYIFSSSRIILYAIAMADCDQDNVEVCEDVLKTKDGIDRLALYNASVGRYFISSLFCIDFM